MTYSIYKVIIIIDLMVKCLVLTYLIIIIFNIQACNVFQYKTKNIKITWLFAVLYSCLFILLFQILRFYNLYRMVDLKLLMLKTYLFFHYTSFLTLYLIVLGIICFGMFFVILNRFFINEIFKLHLYYNYAYVTNTGVHPFRNINRRILLRLGSMGDTDIITFSIHRGITRCTELLYGRPLYNIQTKEILELPKYHIYHLFTRLLYSKDNIYYQIGFKTSPLIFLGYDCVFNNFIITKLYYYLILYIPILLLKKITNYLHNQGSTISKAFWSLYYDTNPSIYAISKDCKPILDAYIHSGFSFEPFIKSVNDAFEQTDLEAYIALNLEFILYNVERQTYMNSQGIYLQIKENGKVYQELEDENGNIYLGEEWVLLADKRIGTKIPKTTRV